MRRTTLTASAAALAVAGILLTGCSDDDSPGESVPTIGDPPPASELAEDAKADAEEGAEGEPGASSTEGAEDGSGEDSDGGADVPEGWLVITDEPSGISVAMPQDVQPLEQDVERKDGGTMVARSYFVQEQDKIEVGFGVFDLAGGTFDLESRLDGIAGVFEGDVTESGDITVAGYDGMEAVVDFDEGTAHLQFIVLDDVALQLMATGAEADRELVEEYFDQITASIDLP